MPLPSIIAGPAKIFYYDKTDTVLTAAPVLQSGDVESAAENPASGIDGAQRIQENTSYNLAVGFYGAHPKGGLALTALPNNFAYSTATGENAIKVTLEAPAGTIAMGLFINDALAGIASTTLKCRNGTADDSEIVVYYEPSSSGLTRSDVVAIMGSDSAYKYSRKSFGETTGPTQLTIQPVTATVQRNAGSDVPLVTSYNVQASASLLASGKTTMASVLNGIATGTTGTPLKTNQAANFGHRGLGVPSARPIEIVGPGETVGEEDSILIFSALKLSSDAITKAWEKENASQLPVVFVSGEDLLVQGIHGSFEYVKN